MVNVNNFKDYLGLGEKPKDFNEFWNKGKKAVDALSTSYELKQVDLPSHVANFYHLYFTGISGARVHAQLVVPKKLEGKHPGVLLFHGYHCDSGDFQDKVGWAAEGFVSLALDCRGQGGLSEDNVPVKGDILEGLIIRGVEEWDPEKLYYYRVFLDLYQAAHILMAMDHIDEKKDLVSRSISRRWTFNRLCRLSSRNL